MFLSDLVLACLGNASWSVPLTWQLSDVWRISNLKENYCVGKAKCQGFIVHFPSGENDIQQLMEIDGERSDSQRTLQPKLGGPEQY